MTINPSCTLCHARRTKCDDKTPCGPCVLRGKHHQCYRRQRKRRQAKEPVRGRAELKDGVVRSKHARVDAFVPADEVKDQDAALSLFSHSLPEWTVCHLLLDDVFRLHGYSIAYPVIPLADLAHKIEAYHSDAPGRYFLGAGDVATIGAVISLSLHLAMDSDLIACHQKANSMRPSSSSHVVDDYTNARHRNDAELRGANLASASFYMLAKALHVDQKDASEPPDVMAITSVPSLSELQAGILLLSSPYLTKAQKMQLFDGLLRLALMMRLDQMDEAPLVASPNEADGEVENVRIESCVRCWWSLVVRSWFMSPLTWTYSIPLSSFNTRKPKSGVQGLSLSHTVGHAPNVAPGWDPVHFLQAMIELAEVARMSVDMRNESEGRVWTNLQRRTIAGAYARTAMALPEHYTFATPLDEGVGGKNENKCATHELERFLLHQRLFANLVHLHTDELASTQGPCSVCVWMCHSILDSMRVMHGRQRMVDSMHVSHLYAFTALKIHLTNLKSNLINDEVNGNCQKTSSQLLMHLSRRRIEETLSLIESSVDQQSTSSDDHRGRPSGTLQQAARLSREFRDVFEQHREPQTYVEMRLALDLFCQICAQADLQSTAQSSVEDNDDENDDRATEQGQEDRDKLNAEQLMELPIQRLWAVLSSQTMLDFIAPNARPSEGR